MADLRLSEKLRTKRNDLTTSNQPHQAGQNQQKFPTLFALRLNFPQKYIIKHRTRT